MPSYLFTGAYERFYPAVFVDGRSLDAKPGDVVDFDGDPPGDGCWAPVDPPAPEVIPFHDPDPDLEPQVDPDLEP